MRRPAAVVALLLLSCCGGGGDTKVTSLEASGAWARATPPGAVDGVAYLTVASPDDDAIVAVSVPGDVAESAALMETMGGAGESPMPNMPEMAGDGEAMSMAPLSEVPVAAGERVSFEPGGKHVMLVDLAGPLVEGDHFTLTLRMASGATLAVDVVIATSAP